jgi:ribosome-associated protein
MENNNLKTIVKALDEKKAVDIRVLKIDDITSLTDCFVICNGTSTTHVKTLADECEVATDKIGYKVRHREGMDSGSWVLLDYGDVIVHIYNKDTRNYYSLEKLWKDGTEIEINDLLED